MARARRGQSGQGSELARAGHSAVKLLRRLFTLREQWWQFCVRFGENGMVFSKILIDKVRQRVTCCVAYS